MSQATTTMDSIERLKMGGKDYSGLPKMSNRQATVNEALYSDDDQLYRANISRQTSFNRAKPSAACYHSGNGQDYRKRYKSMSIDEPVRIGSVNAKTPSPTRAYAGAKCHEAPSPNFLPAPPLHWMSGSCDEMTSLLKVILNVS